eukprot:68183_1
MATLSIELDNAQEAFERDNWESMPPKASLARVHSSLHIGPSLLHYHESIPSPKAMNRIQTKCDGQPLAILKENHIAPNWHHLTLQKIKGSTVSNLKRQKTIIDNELQETTQMIDNACKLRHKWLYKNTTNNGHIGALLPDKRMLTDITKVEQQTSSIAKMYSFIINDGVATVYHADNTDVEDVYFKTHTFDEYLKDTQFMHKLMAFGPAKTLGYHRLKILQRRFQLHLLLNRQVELTEACSVPYRDFYNVRKVDNNIHVSAGMNQKHLLEFMRNKYQKDHDRTVTEDGKTLAQVFEELNINIDHLSVNTLDVHAQQSTWQRFDKFDAKYNPCREKTLRTIFLKIDNFINGQYLAELIKDVFADLESQRYQHAEFRLTVQGGDRSRWRTIATWAHEHQLLSPHVRWVIQIPRIYSQLKESKLVHSFHEMMSNVFDPLFEVTINPSADPVLHLFLQRMVAIDVVGDESRPHKMHLDKYPSPQEWTENNEPKYMYYMYHIYANVYKLNKLRERLRFNTFALRPQCGESGSVDHLSTAFLLAHSINYGIRLFYSPILQYLYYLEQVGISLCPLSNNILYQQYDQNPFPRFFQRGLNISLSSDNPLLIHYTKNPLLEEYSIAAQVYSLTSIDLCEIARNSVLQSGWDHKTKKQWIGKHYHDKKGILSNDIYHTNVPEARIQFRHFLLCEERTFIESFGERMVFKPTHPMTCCTVGPTALLEVKEQSESDDEEETTDALSAFMDDEKLQEEGRLGFRSVLERDMQMICEWELNKNVSKEMLSCRYLFAKEYFKVMTLNGKMIGFVSGERVVQNEDGDGCDLCVEAVIVDRKYRRNGYGTTLMKRYIAEMIESAHELKAIRLCSPKRYIAFFEKLGFKSLHVEHQNDDSCQMVIHMTSGVS